MKCVGGCNSLILVKDKHDLSFWLSLSFSLPFLHTTIFNDDSLQQLRQDKFITQKITYLHVWCDAIDIHHDWIKSKEKKKNFLNFKGHITSKPTSPSNLWLSSFDQEKTHRFRHLTTNYHNQANETKWILIINCLPVFLRLSDIFGHL